MAKSGEPRSRLFGLQRACVWRTIFILAVLLVRTGLGHAQQNVSKTETPLLNTGVTGSVHGSGLDNPQYVLSFVPVQKLILRAVQKPVTSAEVKDQLGGTPVTLDTLLNLGLLRHDGEVYRLNYLVLTVPDQQKIYAVGEKYGHSLATAFLAHQHEFDQLSNMYPNAQLRPEIMFCLVAGVALNWNGLRLTTDLGYRIKPTRFADGSVGFVHSSEVGTKLDFTGLYWDSQSVATSTVGFATFGDGVTWPRLYGLPDMLDEFGAAVSPWRKDATAYGALRRTYHTYLSEALDDAGQILNAVANGHTSDSSIAQSISIPEDRRVAILNLLVATGYLSNAQGHYSITAPFLSDKDKLMVDKVLALSSTIMTDWLRANSSSVRSELADVSPLSNGLPFELVFSEVWHYEFAFAAKELARSGFFANPSDPNRRAIGYVPLVWNMSLFGTPGT